jgi:hypothetical protein
VVIPGYAGWKGGGYGGRWSLEENVFDASKEKEVLLITDRVRMARGSK